MPDALAAVTEPSFANAGRKPATDSAVVPGLMNSSWSNATGSPLRCGIITGTISSLNLPAFWAASALFWLATAKASCSAREMPYCFATFSAVVPMWYWLYTSHSPSTIIVSTSFASPMRKPSREPGSTCGDALMFSWPPAITISASPQRIACTASITALRPEPHTLLIVMAGIAFGSPDLISA